MKILGAGFQYQCERGFEIYRPNGNGHYLFVLFKSPSMVFSDGALQCAEAYASILYPVGACQRYWARQGQLLHDFVEFVPESAEDEAALKGLPYGVLFPERFGPFFERWTEEIALELFSASPCKGRAMHHMTCVLLLRISEFLCAARENPPDERAWRYADALRKIRAAVYSNPQKPWRVAEMAQLVPLSESYFKALYQKAFHISCMRDVIAARIAMAKRYLRQGGESIERIAGLCGYQNAAHFSRQFRAFTGQTPRAYGRGVCEENSGE